MSDFGILGSETLSGDTADLVGTHADILRVMLFVLRSFAETAAHCGPLTGGGRFRRIARQQCRLQRRDITDDRVVFRRVGRDAAVERHMFVRTDLDVVSVIETKHDTAAACDDRIVLKNRFTRLDDLLVPVRADDFHDPFGHAYISNYSSHLLSFSLILNIL